jgi:hypothetical protein
LSPYERLWIEIDQATTRKASGLPPEKARRADLSYKFSGRALRVWGSRLQLNVNLDICSTHPPIFVQVFILRELQLVCESLRHIIGG